MNLLKFLALVTIFALVSCSDDNPVCSSCNDEDPGGSSTMLQTEGWTFVKGQPLPENTVQFIDSKFEGDDVAPGATMKLKIASVNEMSELYLKINSEDGYYIRQIAAENIVNDEPGSYAYEFTFVFSLDLNHEGQMGFTIRGKAK